MASTERERRNGRPKGSLNFQGYERDALVDLVHEQLSQMDGDPTKTPAAWKRLADAFSERMQREDRPAATHHRPVVTLRKKWAEVVRCFRKARQQGKPFDRAQLGFDGAKVMAVLAREGHVFEPVTGSPVAPLVAPGAAAAAAAAASSAAAAAGPSMPPGATSIMHAASAVVTMPPAVTGKRDAPPADYGGDHAAKRTRYMGGAAGATGEQLVGFRELELDDLAGRFLEAYNHARRHSEVWKGARDLAAELDLLDDQMALRFEGKSRKVCSAAVVFTRGARSGVPPPPPRLASLRVAVLASRLETLTGVVRTMLETLPSCRDQLRDKVRRPLLNLVNDL